MKTISHVLIDAYVCYKSLYSFYGHGRIRKIVSDQSILNHVNGYKKLDSIYATVNTVFVIRELTQPWSPHRASLHVNIMRNQIIREENNVQLR